MARGPQKIFVSDSGFATITCPKCRQARQVSMARYRGKKHTMKVRCTCGHDFLTAFEFRRHYRKQTDLGGTYRILSTGAAGGGPIAIHNISRGGIGFSVSGTHNLQVGHRAQVDFLLDNRKQSRMQKTVVIRTIRQNHIGCQFEENQAFEKDLGFYLQP